MCDYVPLIKQGGKMQVDELRQDMVELFTQIQPKIQEGVFSPDAFRSHFETPYRARTLQKLRDYEKAHKTLFCRQCIEKHEKKSYLLCYQLWIEESDNLLDNKPGEWVSMQCMNSECDFDLITPRPVVPDTNKEQMDRMLEEMKKYQQNPHSNQQAQNHMNDMFRYQQTALNSQRNMTAQEVNYRQQEHAAQLRNAAMQINPIIGQDYSALEARVLGGLSAAGQAGSLSSAGTSGVAQAPEPKQSKFEELKKKYGL